MILHARRDRAALETMSSEAARIEPGGGGAGLDHVGDGLGRQRVEANAG